MPTETTENWVNISWFENYLTAQVSPPSHWIFIRDVASIFPDLHTLNLFDQQYEVIFFESDLQIRQKLERYKDNRGERCVCIVSQQPHEIDGHIRDYIARSCSIEITPQSILEFAQPEYNWPREVNQLGRDFWRLFERLQESRRNYPRLLTPAEGTNLLLSAHLEIDLRENLSAREAIDIWQRLEKDKTLIAWGEKYPKLLQALNLKVRVALPLMEKLEGDADFVCFLWTSYALAQHNKDYDLFLPRIFGERIWKKYGNTPTKQIREGCRQLIRNNPERVIDQIKQTEIWLTQEGHRLELFQRWVGVDALNLSKTAQYAKKETLFCVSMREALRLLAAQICRAPESLDAIAIQEILYNIERQHLFLNDDTNYLRIQEAFRAFADLVELNRLIARVESKSWLDASYQKVDKDRKADIWPKEAYPAYISKLDFSADRLEQLNFQYDFLPHTVVAQALDRAHKVVDQYNREFAQWVTDAYSSCISQKRDEPLFTSDFLETLFLPRYQKYIQGTSHSAYIFIFDAMRWDTWEWVKPGVLRAFRGRFALERVFPLLSILPTTTVYNKPAILMGQIPQRKIFQGGPDPAFKWWEELSTAFQKRGIDNVQWVSDKGNNQAQILDVIESDEVAIKIFNFTFIDQKLHHAAQNLSTVYEEIKVNFDLAVQPYLERIPFDSLIFMLSDHGFIEISDQRRISEDAFQRSHVSEVHQRYVGLSSYAKPANLAHLCFFSADDIGLQPESDYLQYGFATSRTQILPAADSQRQNGRSPGRAVRYAHGGISMQEMIVPCAVFVPTAEGQLEMF